MCQDDPVRQAVQFIWLTSTDEATHVAKQLDKQRVRQLIKDTTKRLNPAPAETVVAPRLESAGLQHQADVLIGLKRCLCRRIEGAINLEEDCLDDDVIIWEVAKASSVINHRPKILRIADIGGWDAVKKYEGAADIGHSIENSKPIQKCVAKAKDKQARRGNFRPNPYQPRSMQQNPMAQFHHPMVQFHSQARRQSFGGSYAPKMAPFGSPTRWRQTCFNCGKIGHWKNECPSS